MSDEKRDARTLPQELPSADTLGDARTQKDGRPPRKLDASERLGGGELLGDRYRILEELGRGGEGVVYGAHDLRADQVVALKLLRHDPGRLEGYRRELRMARRVTHENAVRIHDIVDLPDRFGLSMEFVRGETLEKRLQRTGPMPYEHLLALARDVASALNAAHGAGVTHRDLKPSNVILREKTDRAVVTDFGVARLHDVDDAVPGSRIGLPSRSGTTTLGTIVGTPLYMSPEQLTGEPDIGPAADVYAFGLLLREAAAGKALHEDATAFADLRALSDKHVPSLAAERPDLPASFVAFVDRCLEPRRADRFADGAELLHGLKSVEGFASSPPPPQRPRGRLASGGKAAVAVVALALVTSGVALASRHWAPAGVAQTPSATSVAAPPPFAPTHARRITFEATCDELPSFTPDDTSLVFDRTTGGASNIFVMDLRTNTTRAVTQLDGWNYGARVSPDGSTVTFLHQLGGAVGAYVVPVDGTAPPRLFASGVANPDWSVDGRSIWAGEDAELVRYDLESGTPVERISEPPGFASGGAFAADHGRLVVFAGRGYDTVTISLGVRDPDGSWRKLLAGPLNVSAAFWPDRDHALVAKVHPDTDAVDLVLVPLDGSAPQVLAATGITPRTGIAVSPDRRLVAWSMCGASTELVSLDDKTGATPFHSEGMGSVTSAAPLGGTNSFVEIANRGGPRQAWVVDLSNRTPPRVLRTGNHLPDTVTTSLDGKWVLFPVVGDGLFLVPADGTAEPSRLATGAVHNASMMGDLVYFDRGRADGSSEVLAVPREGGEPRPVIPSGSNPIAMADGRLLFLDGDGARMTPMLFDPRTGTRVPLTAHLPQGHYVSACLAVDGRRAVLLDYPHDVAEVDVNTGALLRHVKSIEDLREVACIGGRLLATRRKWEGNLWLADLAVGP